MHVFIDVQIFLPPVSEVACHNLIRASSLKALTAVSPHKNCNKQNHLSPIVAIDKRDNTWPRNAEIQFELPGLFLTRAEI